MPVLVLRIDLSIYCRIFSCRHRSSRGQPRPPTPETVISLADSDIEEEFGRIFENITPPTEAAATSAVWRQRPQHAASGGDKCRPGPPSKSCKGARSEAAPAAGTTTTTTTHATTCAGPSAASDTTTTAAASAPCKWTPAAAAATTADDGPANQSAGAKTQHSTVAAGATCVLCSKRSHALK
ncbi:uncharacterized protein LOC116166691 [Photinus pyralis]|uniref:uncharacterized protein LOC116166691 n=1 Tax=Photinus pyralis TaxID=7054 RepID=UPI001266F1AD|nr:uncharacterized protein LOC116166691 [Photinus pyralis]